MRLTHRVLAQTVRRLTSVRAGRPLVSFAAALVLLASCQRSRPTPSTVASSPVDADPLRSLPAALYGARLPDRLDDTTFWRLSTELSDSAGYFQSENFVSNEMGLQHVISYLQTLTPPGGAYVGVGPEQNFTYIASLQPRIAFIVDIRRQNLLQHLWYKAVFELSPTRAQFLARLFARPSVAKAPASLSADSLLTLLNVARPDTNAFRATFAEVRRHLVQRHGFAMDSTDLATLHYVDSIFFISGPTLNYSSGTAGRGGRGFGRGMPSFAQIMTTSDERGANRGFLGSDELYAYVRDLERRNLVIPVVGDFARPKALRAVGAWLRDRGARVNMFYTSNVEQYLFQSPNNWSNFYANVATMPTDSSSRFIRSVTSGAGRGGGYAFGGAGSGFLMQQLTSSVGEIIGGAKDGTVRTYFDIIQRSRPQ